jgi:hypothetical protein
MALSHQERVCRHEYQTSLKKEADGRTEQDVEDHDVVLSLLSLPYPTKLCHELTLREPIFFCLSALLLSTLCAMSFTPGILAALSVSVSVGLDIRLRFGDGIGRVVTIDISSSAALSYCRRWHCWRVYRMVIWMKDRHPTHRQPNNNMLSLLS